MDPLQTPVRARGSGERYWLHALLFLLTVYTTCAVGARFADNFERNRPSVLLEDMEASFDNLGRPAELPRGLLFSLTLVTILLAHEMGHYLTCRYYRIHASLPYFLPAPTLIGTLGAFIRIRSPIMSRRHLFDIGVSGPLAGFAFVVPALGIGLALSKVIPGIGARGDFAFSTPGILHLLQAAIFPGAAPGDVLLHPIARAAWVGVLATALNLLPIGQLDGGHILYAFTGSRHQLLSRLFLAALIPLGIFYSYSWLLWAALLFFFGMRHPRIYDAQPMDAARRKLAILSLAIFLLSFSVAPISAG